MGEYNSHFRAAITREVNALQGLVVTGVKRIARRRPPEPAELHEELLPDGDTPAS